MRTSRVELCPGCQRRLPPPPALLCEICGLPFAGVGSNHACAKCALRPPHFSRARALTTYRRGDPNPVVDIIERCKYGRDLSHLPVLAEMLAAQTVLAIEHDVIVPVPLHRQRMRWRGFNQSALLAQSLGRRARRDVDVWSLARGQATRPQVGLGELQRRRNVAGAFVVRRPAAVDGRTVLLVDDVMTTGSTLNECARILLRAGVRRVDALVLARALDHT